MLVKKSVDLFYLLVKIVLDVFGECSSTEISLRIQNTQVNMTKKLKVSVFIEQVSTAHRQDQF